ncbi:MAG TPA: PEP-utilizing enzyme [Acidobacteriota bacterium]|nr:PEP-utilizing enzyme [Acidobacteriota bacterium]
MKLEYLGKGLVASDGQIRGNVFNLESSATPPCEAYVLVAKYTQPELVKYMRQALAIVTEVGGILSHAAVVSRELNIPCIVGVQNITQSAKSLDTICADMDSGEVFRCSD